jgi:hypothetical protein
MNHHLLLAGVMALVALPAAARAQDTTQGPVVHFGAFADAYYAYDVGRPPDGDRAYTTQPSRHDEFNVNLAFVEATVSHARYRGRVALQAGTSVQDNYAEEPRRGTVSGPDVARFIQEAVAGVRLAEGLWVDAGIYFSHIGQESWISRDNPTYTRSLTADYTPYYSAGARVAWQATPRLAIQLQVLNGWQNIAESNGDKAVGARVEWQAADGVLLGYANFVGNERPDSLPGATRVFNEVFAKLTPAAGTDVWITANLGTEAGESWHSVTLIGRRQLSPSVAIAGRVERYADPAQRIVVTGGAEGFEAWGASVNVDVAVLARALWRTEVRGFLGESPLFPDGGDAPRKEGGFVVTSLAVTF